MGRKNQRGTKQIRKVKLSRGFIKPADGSCLIEMGDTKVVCTSSFEQNIPSFLKGQGQGWLTAEYGMLPGATDVRMNRNKISGRTFEIQRLIGRALRSVIDLGKIGENTLWIDCDVIQADGGTRTASVTGGFVAMVDCLEKLQKKGILKEIPVRHYLAAVSAGIVRDELLLDLNYAEDSKADLDTNVVMNSDEEFVEVQGTAENGTFPRSTLDDILDVTAGGIKELIKIQRKELRDILLI